MPIRQPHHEKGRIIRLRPENYSLCANIWNMKEEPERAKQWYDEIVAGNRTVFVYTENGEYLAEDALVRENGDRDYTVPGRRIYLSRLIVKPACRNRGIGGRLTGLLTAQAKRMGYREIALGVDKTNPIALRLYREKGFTTVLFDGADADGAFYKLLKRLD